MELKNDQVIQPDHPVTRKALKVCERLWKKYGRPKGVMLTHGKDGIHSAGSWHPIGAAFDCRNNYFSDTIKKQIYDELKAALLDYDVVEHSTHIHVEPGDALAKKWGLML